MSLTLEAFLRSPIRHGWVRYVSKTLYTFDVSMRKDTRIDMHRAKCLKVLTISGLAPVKDNMRLMGGEEMIPSTQSFREFYRGLFFTAKLEGFRGLFFENVTSPKLIAVLLKWGFEPYHPVHDCYIMLYRPAKKRKRFQSEIEKGARP